MSHLAILVNDEKKILAFFKRGWRWINHRNYGFQCWWHMWFALFSVIAYYWRISARAIRRLHNRSPRTCSFFYSFVLSNRRPILLSAHGFTRTCNPSILALWSSCWWFIVSEWQIPAKLKKRTKRESDNCRPRACHERSRATRYLNEDLRCLCSKE